MSTHLGGRISLFLAPPTLEPTEHLDVPFDVSEDGMRRLRNPFHAGPAGTELSRSADDGMAVTAARL